MTMKSRLLTGQTRLALAIRDRQAGTRGRWSILLLLNGDAIAIMEL
jgi:hypothetical protein